MCPPRSLTTREGPGQGQGWGTEHLRLPAWFVVMLTMAAWRGSELRSDTPLTASIQKE